LRNPTQLAKGDSLLKRLSMHIRGEQQKEQKPTITNGSVNKISVAPSGLREVSLKILVVGNGSTGKTSLIARYTEGTYFGTTKTTIGCDFSEKTIQRWDKGCQLKLLLWDIAGQDRFANMTRVYYKDAHAAFVVFDLATESSFKGSVAWKEDIDSKVRLDDGSKIPVVLLANKCDVPEFMEGFSESTMHNFCLSHGFSAWFKTSAKHNLGMEAAVDFLVDRIFDSFAAVQTNKSNSASAFRLNPSAKNEKNTSCCT